MTKTHKPDGAAVLAAALFDLSERAMRDAARLAVIASEIARGRLDYGHFALSNYIARRDGNAYGRDEAGKINIEIEEMCPEIGLKAGRYRKVKAKTEAAMAESGERWKRHDAAVAAGMDPEEARERFIEAPCRLKKRTRGASAANVVAVNFRPRGGAA